MPKWHVTAAVNGSKYIGEFEADTESDAIQQALHSDEAVVNLCHQCADECADAEVQQFFVSEATDER